MFRSLFIVLGFLSLTFFSCKSESKLSDTQKIEANVRDFFFLTDSVEVQIEITDTLFVTDLEEMLATVNQNLNLMDRDLDTLSARIDKVAYAKLNYEKELESAGLFRKNAVKDSLTDARFSLVQYQLQQAQLQARLLGSKQTNRILLHLKRSVWADVAGFNIHVVYQMEDDSVDLDLLLDANFNVVD